MTNAVPRILLPIQLSLTMLRVLILLAVTSTALAAVAIAKKSTPPPEYEGLEGCWIPENEEFLLVNEVSPSKSKCEQYRCRTDDVQIESCGAVAVVEPYKLVSDPSLPYPDCCPKPVLISNQGGEETPQDDCGVNYSK